jgi:anti-sigma factor RsiW
MTEQHLDEGMVQRLLDEEIQRTDMAGIHAHIDACAECRERVAVARREESDVLSRLAILDVPSPTMDRGFPAIAGPALPLRRGPASGGAWRWAAGILLAVGVTGVALAAPSSPVRWLVDRVSSWFSAPAGDVIRGTVADTPPTAGGIILEPTAPALLELQVLQPFDTIRVTLADDGAISVSASGGTVTFESDIGRLSIRNTSGVATIDVVIPRSAPRVEIRTGTRRLYLKDGSSVTSASADSTGGRHVIVPDRG